MAATVVIISAHGATITTTETDVTSATIKYKRADNDTNDSADPVPKPGAGEVFSWVKNMRIKVTVTPDGDITNLRWYSDGVAIATGVILYVATMATGSYVQSAAGAGSLSGTASVKITGGTNATTYTSGSPLVVNSGTVLSNPSTGYGTQDATVSQMGVDSTASRGTKGPKTYTFRFDES